ncbi:hypothetical protein OHB12_00545 [Nocardia sp. NBC_01730]|uniref:hypothetical protein n=1 Tax=Nocardia sp. NBC_01730 TaxID=2975998 RepID=UPI002E13FAF6|nr:hypothetical protein OHB12_00545 [Nocardia sp. NBC_01730]
MEQHTQVTTDDLRRLLGAGPTARLVLVEGHVSIAPGADDGGGLIIVTREELADTTRDDSGDRALAEKAAIFNADIRLRGA